MLWLFRKPKITDGEIDLVESYKIDGCKENNYIPSICYDIRLHSKHVNVGRCDLRLGMDQELYYAGNIGYNVAVTYRGNKYAYKACKLLLKIAKEQYLMDEVLITCNPDNIPSRKTCDYLDGEYLGIVDVPFGHWLRGQGDFQKCIYRYKI